MRKNHTSLARSRSCHIIAATTPLSVPCTAGDLSTVTVRSGMGYLERHIVVHLSIPRFGPSGAQLLAPPV